MIEKTTIGKAFKLKSGVMLSAQNMNNGKYPVFGGNGISGYHDEFMFEEPRIVIGRVGAYCGNVHRTKHNSWITDNALYIDQKLQSYSDDYLIYLLRNLHLNQYASQSGQPLISYGRIKDIEIPLPPLSTQKKIAAILDAADAYRQKTKTLIEKYDQLAQSLFLDMFGDPVRNPKGWEMKTIENLVKKEKCSIKRGPFGGALKKEIFVESGYLVYEQFHALNNDFTFERYYIDDAKFEELKGFEVKPGDIIISCSGVYLGKLATVPQGAKRGIINQALLKVSIDQNKMRNDFFIFHFTHKNFKDKYFEANRGAGIPNFPPMEDFKRFQFISPPIQVQNQFAERIQLIEAQKQQAQASLQKAEDLFNSLLQRAFKGELVAE